MRLDVERLIPPPSGNGAEPHPAASTAKSLPAWRRFLLRLALGRRMG